MAKRVFTEEERDECREKMLAAGAPLLAEYGMTHMSVAKITQAAGIGVSTFYNFFPSKEAYVMDVLEYQRRKIPELVAMVLQGKEKAGPDEVRAYLRLMIDPKYSVFPHLRPEDEQKLLEMAPDRATPDLAHETKIAHIALSYIEGARDDIDAGVLANLIKIYVLAAEGRNILHEARYEATMERLRDLIIEEVFC